MKIEKFSGINADFSLVELRDDGNIGRLTPHCKKHGAMNKLNDYLWRCVTTYKIGKDDKFMGSDCNACCVEVAEDNEK